MKATKREDDEGAGKLTKTHRNRLSDADRCPSPARSALTEETRTDLGSWRHHHILRLIWVLASGAEAKLRLDLPVSPLFIYHQLPPTTEKNLFSLDL